MSGRRRDIGNSIVFLGLLLILLIGYHGWFRSSTPPPEVGDPGFETTFPPSPVAASLPVEAPPSPSAPPASPAVPTPPLPRISDAQAVEVAEPPATKHAGTLLTIRSMIEQDLDRDADAYLSKLPREVLLNAELRAYVAVLWNNLGVLQSRLHGPETAIRSYIKGLDLDPANPALNLNLAHAYWDKQDPRLSREFLEKLAMLVPDDPFPHIALADLLYGKDDLAGAVRELDRAAELAKANPRLTGYLEMVRAKVKSAGQTETAFVARESAHFVVKFDGAEDYAIWDEVLDILEDAYRDIGQKLGYFPSQPIHVVLLTREKFQGVEGTPAWADALYDRVLGRIKIPTQGALTDRGWLKRVLRHEFVHALLHERMGLEIDAVPTWLNEGLAMQLAGDSWSDLDRLARGGELRLMPLSALEQGWGTLPMEVASLAYLEANSATRYMVKRFGMARVREILDLLKSGHHISGAIHTKLMIPYDVFQKRWTQDLDARLTARRT